MGKTLPILALVLLSLGGYQLWQRSQGTDSLVYRDWVTGKAEARESGRPILISYGGPW